MSRNSRESATVLVKNNNRDFIGIKVMFLCESMIKKVEKEICFIDLIKILML